MNKTDLVVEYAMRFLGTPYRWGGNTPFVGWDCSGFTCEILKAFGILHRKEDLTSTDLFFRLTKSYGAHPYVEKGCILFFGDRLESISHVGIAISDKLMIESGGGDSTTNNIQMADLKAAFVRIRPLRKDLIGRVMPRYDAI